jgi:hypothetical protein
MGSVGERRRLPHTVARPSPATVALIDTEMDERQMRRWLRAQSIKNRDRVSVKPLRGAVSTFNILDPDVMATWADG